MSNNNKNKTELKRLRAVDRAIADLRRGLSVVVTGEDEASLILSTEMAYDVELEALAARSGAEPVSPSRPIARMYCIYSRQGTIPSA